MSEKEYKIIVSSESSLHACMIAIPLSLDVNIGSFIHSLSHLIRD